jgi:hypothetical protein
MMSENSASEEVAAPAKRSRAIAVLSSIGDLTPVLGHVKMGVEGVLGRTIDGFSLSPFERFCYVSSTGFTFYSYYVLYLLTTDPSLEHGALATEVSAGYWLSLAAGKARQTGEILSVQSLWAKAKHDLGGKAERLRTLLVKLARDEST